MAQNQPPVNPDTLQFHLQHAIKLHQQGNLQVASEIYRQLATIFPNNADVLLFFATAEYQRANFAESAKLFKQLLKINPRHVQALYLLSQVLYQLGHLDEALQSIKRAIQLQFNHAEAHQHCGNVLQAMGQLNEAIHHYQQAILLKSDYAEAYNNLGNVLQMLQRFDDAIQNYKKALQLKPDFAAAYSNYASTLHHLQEFDQALQAYDQAIQFNPQDAYTYYNKANTLRDLNRINEAIDYYEHAIQLRPDFADAYWNKSLAKLLLGEYQEGWALYEWRWNRPIKKNTYKQFTQPLWLGESACRDKTILIHAEQGLGDTIQFCRYIPLLADQGAKIIFQVQAPLQRLLKNFAAIATIITNDDPCLTYDYQCPLLSLPLAFKTTLSAIPVSIPYLYSEPEKAAYWKNKLGQYKKFRVGIVWSGGFRADQPDVWAVNARRNIPLDKFTCLNLPNVEFISLQKGEEAVTQLRELEQSLWDGPYIIDYTDELHDFSDTAALIDNLDLVISVDTSTAHLAGALGKPVWILNRFDTCWRWLLNRNDSPWYPTVKLFRQTSFGNWNTVMQNVRLALEKLSADFLSHKN